MKMEANKHVIIYHSPLAENAPADELDVLDEAAYFLAGLEKLGYDVLVWPFPFDMKTLEKQLQQVKPGIVVNLVETILGSGRLVHIGPAFFEHFQVPYTGCQSGAIYATSDKILAKKLMNDAGIPTAEFLTYDSLKKRPEISAGPWIVKSVWEHASFGLDENEKLLFENRDELLNRFEKEKNPEHFFAERYIHGREFNLSIIGGKNDPEVLPPAEIRFTYPEGKPRIVGYKAKWAEESFEYANTNRSFDFTEEDQGLLEELKQICHQCWEVFGLSGYARVDFRVDEAGNIFVLEINANPCISADSGFVAAATRAGLSQKELIGRIVDAVFSK
jgi:D-alanine-D-alanine ligase